MFSGLMAQYPFGMLEEQIEKYSNQISPKFVQDNGQEQVIRCIALHTW